MRDRNAAVGWVVAEVVAVVVLRKMGARAPLEPHELAVAAADDEDGGSQRGLLRDGGARPLHRLAVAEPAAGGEAVHVLLGDRLQLADLLFDPSRPGKQLGVAGRTRTAAGRPRWLCRRRSSGEANDLLQQVGNLAGVALEQALDLLLATAID